MSHLTPELAAHLADSYPHNHDYRIVRGRLKPSWQLWRRWRKLRKHYPTGSDGRLESLLDLSSCKGFFVLDAALRLGARRAQGIDIHEPDLVASSAAARELGQEQVRFERLLPHELVERGDEPYGAALLVNTYPYLYFGSLREPHGYADHERLFDLFAALVAPGGRLLFSNRVELARCPRHIRELAVERGLDGGYDEARIRAAADRHFRIEPRGSLGKIPLWILHRR